MEEYKPIVLEFLERYRDNFTTKLKKEKPEIYSFIFSNYIGNKFTEKTYNFIYPNKGKCLVCDKVPKFSSFNKGYLEYCSCSCRSKQKSITATEIRNCVVCNNVFSIHKKREKTTCSPECLSFLLNTPEVRNKMLIGRTKTFLKKYGMMYTQTEEFKKKLKKTKLERHGNENYTNLELNKKTKLERYGNPVYNNPDKIKKTCLEKYGVDNFAKTEEYTKLFKKTCNNKYGVDYPQQNHLICNKTNLTFDKLYDGRGFGSDKINKKIEDTMVDLYGVKYCNQNKDILNKCTRSALDLYYNNLINSEKIKDKVELLFPKEEYFGTKVNRYNFKCLKCDTKFEDSLEDGNEPNCPICFPNPPGRSYLEREVYDYLQSVTKSKIIMNRRNILGKYELDFYIEDFKLAIEVNGIFWHSENFGNKDKNYHLNKTQMCETRGIKLIHVFENEWVYKNDIVKNRIRNALHCNTEKVYARKCSIKEISYLEKKEFLETHHLQGDDKSSVKCGLFLENELVSVMSFGKMRICLGNKNSLENEYEMVRFCSKRNVIGGASKLLNYFIKAYKPKKITTFADRRYSNSNSVYEKIGFKFVKNTPPNYWYFNLKNSLSVFHRFNYRKDQLPKKLQIFDINLTEWENMKLNGFDRIWDCGNIKYEMDLI